MVNVERESLSFRKRRSSDYPQKWLERSQLRSLFLCPLFFRLVAKCPKRMFVTTVLFTSFIRQGLHQKIFFRNNYLGYLESQACEHKNNPRTHIRIHSIHFLRLLNQISGHPTKPRRFYFAFTHLRVNGQMSLIPECSGFVANPEESLLM